MTNLAVSADGTLIAYETHGAGTPALVFVHGWSCDRTYWAGQMQPFARQFKVVAVDLAGHGESALGRNTWTIQAFGSDVAAVVTTMGLQRVILIGHSMGGDVIVEAARRLQGRILGLVWLDTYAKLGAPRTPDQLQALLAPFHAHFVDATQAFVRSMFAPTSDPALVDRVAADMSSAPSEVALGALACAMSFDREIPAALRRLKLPVVAINADNRSTDVPSLTCHSVNVLVMSGAGHFLMMDDPERFNGLLSTAVNQIIEAQ
jgi:pimeloyl-ACP methyl ester carboxylesterase